MGARCLSELGDQELIARYCAVRTTPGRKRDDLRTEIEIRVDQARDRGERIVHAGWLYMLDQAGDLMRYRAKQMPAPGSKKRAAMNAAQMARSA